jgi:hypothetical protein
MGVQADSNVVCPIWLYRVEANARSVELIREFEDFQNGHKARYVSLGRDTGYGATCWSIDMGMEGNRKFTVSELDVMDSSVQSLGYPECQDDDCRCDDYSGLMAVIRRALEIAKG